MDDVVMDDMYHDKIFDWIQTQNKKDEEDVLSNNDTISTKEKEENEVTISDIKKTIKSYQTNSEKRIDYASIQYGAKILTYTSPSIIDTLPIYNKILSLLKLRFYGYGPNKILSSFNDRGQCWS